MHRKWRLWIVLGSLFAALTAGYALPESPDVDSLISRMESGTLKERLAAAETLNKQMSQTLGSFSESQKSRVRKIYETILYQKDEIPLFEAAAEGLGYLHHPRSLNYLLDASQSGLDPDLQRAAVRALVRFAAAPEAMSEKAKKTLEGHLKLLAGDDEQLLSVRAAAQVALLPLQGDKAAERFGDLFKETPSGNRYSLSVYLSTEMETLASQGQAGLRALAPLLHDDQPLLRGIAVRALGQRGNQAALPLAAAALKDKDLHIRGMAALALGAIDGPDAYNLLHQALLEKDTADPLNERVDILRGLSCTTDPRAFQDLLAHIENNPPEVQQVALQELERLHAPISAIPVIRNVLVDPKSNWGTKYYAVQVLRDLGESALSPLLEGLHDPDESIVKQAADALRQFKRPDVAAALADRLQKPGLKPEDLKELVQALMIQGKAGLEAAGRLARAGLPALQEAVADVLTDWLEPECYDTLMAILKDPKASASTQRKAAGGLCRLKDPRAVQAIFDYWKKGDSDRDGFLGGFEPGVILPLLLETLKKGTNPEVRKHVVDLLGELRDPLALPALMEAVVHDSPEVATAAAQQLSLFTLSADHVAVLHKMVADKTVDSPRRGAIASILGSPSRPASLPILQQVFKAEPDNEALVRGLYEGISAYDEKGLKDETALSIIGNPKLSADLRSLAMVQFTWPLRWPPSQRSMLLSLMKEHAIRDDTLIQNVMELLAHLNEPRAIPDMISLLGDQSLRERVRQDAAEYMGKLGHPLVARKDPESQAQVAAAIAALKKAYLTDPEIWVRRYARDALLYLGVKGLPPVLDKKPVLPPAAPEKAKPQAPGGIQRSAVYSPESTNPILMISPHPPSHYRRADGSLDTSPLDPGWTPHGDLRPVSHQGS